jgi:hypothetical protein
MRRQRAAFLLCAALGSASIANAGHEFPFYPSFYPQEITVEALDGRAAAKRLAQGTLHGYAAGALAAGVDAGKIGTVTSLRGYVVVTFDARAPGLEERSTRCAAARGLKEAIGEGSTWHPYPVTPFHADYLRHADRAESARAAAGAPPAARLRAHAKIESVDVAALIAKARERFDGWDGPPWIRQGWFHAYLLLAPAVTDAAERERIDAAAQRLMRGDFPALEPRIEAERNLVALLQRGCERVVLGYTVRREAYGAEYSRGVQNVGFDALEGMAAGIHPRTVKLRDFPWNGWLNVAVPSPPASAWNPVVGGFADPYGRLVWSSIGDPAFLPAPHAGGWIENRVLVAETARVSEVPEDALLPEAGSGRLAPVGRGKTATLRIVYRVLNSDFHDGTTMSVADLLFPYAFAARWGAGPAADPAVARATANARERVKGIRLLRVDTETLAFGEDSLRYTVPVIEIYLDGDPGPDAAAVAPPWSTLPWHVLALFEEGARRGLYAFAEFDPVRNAALVRRLAEVARDLESRAHVPPALARHVTADEARARFKKLREFHAARGHWLVTNGPYMLGRWDGKKAVLGVFRDVSYPKGIGNFDALAVPIHAHITRIEPRGDGADVLTESEWLERLGREVRVVRGSFAKRLAERITGAGVTAPPVCHYMLLGEDGAVVSAGASKADGNGTCHLEFARSGPLRGKRLRLVVAAVLEDNMDNAAVRIVPWER